MSYKYKEDEKKWLKDNKDHRKIYMKKYQKDNEERIKIYKKKYREDNKDKFNIYSKKYYEKNRDKIINKTKIYNKKYRRKGIKELSDPYIKGLLAKDSNILTHADIPQELIEAKRLEVQIKRTTKGKQ